MRRWTEGELTGCQANSAGNVMTGEDRKQKNIVVRCLQPSKGYGLLRERGRTIMKLFFNFLDNVLLTYLNFIFVIFFVHVLLTNSERLFEVIKTKKGQ